MKTQTSKEKRERLVALLDELDQLNKACDRMKRRVNRIMEEKKEIDSTPVVD